MPPLPSFFIISAICRCIFSTLLTSCTLVPEPAATRRFRLAFISFGASRSARVMDEIIAAWRNNSRSSIPRAPNCFFILPMPGNMPSTPDMPPMACICFICSAISSSVNWPFFMRAAIFSAFSASMVSAAFSTRPTTSPMPRMRLAIRAGSNNSILSIASPTPRNLIGTPVTWRMESAAPPRPSPSARVNTMPDKDTRLAN